MRGIVAGDIRDHKRENFRFANGSKPPALDQRQMLSDRVDFLDHCAAAQKFLGRCFEVRHRNRFDRQAQ